MAKERNKRLSTVGDGVLRASHMRLHMWRSNNWAKKPKDWTKREVVNEHNRLAKIIVRMGYEHNSPLTV